MKRLVQDHTVRAEPGFETKSDARTVGLTIGQHCFSFVGTSWASIAPGVTRIRQHRGTAATIPTHTHLGTVSLGYSKKTLG